MTDTFEAFDILSTSHSLLEDLHHLVVRHGAFFLWQKQPPAELSKAIEQQLQWGQRKRLLRADYDYWSISGPHAHARYSTTTLSVAAFQLSPYFQLGLRRAKIDCDQFDPSWLSWVKELRQIAAWQLPPMSIHLHMKVNVLTTPHFCNICQLYFTPDRDNIN